MSIVMKLLAGIVAVAGVILFVQMNKHTPFGKGPEAFLAFLPGLIVLPAVLYALGEILAKLDVVIASLDRPQIASSTSEPTAPPQSPAERFASGEPRTASE